DPDTARNRWNWLADTRWYVPAENLLAYLAEPSLSGRIPVADQTLWSLTEARDGHFLGTAYTELWAKRPAGGFVQLLATTNTMEGDITEDGTITIVFTPEDPTHPQTVGYGHMRFVDKAWRMEM